MTVHRFRLEGDLKDRPKRIVDLALPWRVAQIAGHQQSSLTAPDGEQR